MPKTNREKLNAMSDQEFADMLCTMMEKIAKKTKDGDWCCDICPATDLCKKKQNGFRKWLEKEAEG